MIAMFTFERVYGERKKKNMGMLSVEFTKTFVGCGKVWHVDFENQHVVQVVSLLHTFSLEFLISLSVNMFVEFWLPIKIWNAPFYAPRDHFVTSFACSDIHGDFIDKWL